MEATGTTKAPFDAEAFAADLNAELVELFAREMEPASPGDEKPAKNSE
jgi:hypothetical protein